MDKSTYFKTTGMVVAFVMPKLDIHLVLVGLMAVWQADKSLVVKKNVKLYILTSNTFLLLLLSSSHVGYCSSLQSVTDHCNTLPTKNTLAVKKVVAKGCYKKDVKSKGVAKAGMLFTLKH